MSKDIHEQTFLSSNRKPGLISPPPFPPQAAELGGGLNCPLSHVALLYYSLQSGRTCDTEHTQPDCKHGPCPVSINPRSDFAPNCTQVVPNIKPSVPKLYPPSSHLSQVVPISSHLSQGCEGDDVGAEQHGEPLPTHGARLRG